MYRSANEKEKSAENSFIAKKSMPTAIPEEEFFKLGSLQPPPANHSKNLQKPSKEDMLNAPNQTRKLTIPLKYTGDRSRGSSINTPESATSVPQNSEAPDMNIQQKDFILVGYMEDKSESLDKKSHDAGSHDAHHEEVVEIDFNELLQKKEVKKESSLNKTLMNAKKTSLSIKSGSKSSKRRRVNDSLHRQ